MSQNFLQCGFIHHDGWWHVWRGRRPPGSGPQGSRHVPPSRPSGRASALPLRPDTPGWPADTFTSTQLKPSLEPGETGGCWLRLSPSCPSVIGRSCPRSLWWTPAGWTGCRLASPPVYGCVATAGPAGQTVGVSVASAMSDVFAQLHAVQFLQVLQGHSQLHSVTQIQLTWVQHEIFCVLTATYVNRRQRARIKCYFCVSVRWAAAATVTASIFQPVSQCDAGPSFYCRDQRYFHVSLVKVTVRLLRIPQYEVGLTCVFFPCRSCVLASSFNLHIHKTHNRLMSENTAADKWKTGSLDQIKTKTYVIVMSLLLWCHFNWIQFLSTIRLNKLSLV